MKAALATYDSLGEQRKFDLCELVLQIQDMITSNKATDTTQETDGVVVSVPASSEVRRESRKRLKPALEYAVSKGRSLVLNHKPTGIKVNEKVQRLGLSQDVSEGGIVYEVRGKPGGGCQFCSKRDGHRYTNCPERRTWLKKGVEYQVSQDSPAVAKALKDRLKGNMPYTTIPSKGAPIGKITKEMSGMNFVIHAACAAAGERPGGVDSSNYCVSYLGADGEAMSGKKEIWITGDMMTVMISVAQQRKKATFVFDETVHMKEGWESRMVPSHVDDSGLPSNGSCPSNGC